MLKFTAIYDSYAHAILQNTVKTSGEPQRDSNGEIFARSLIDKNGKQPYQKTYIKHMKAKLFWISSGF